MKLDIIQRFIDLFQWNNNDTELTELAVTCIRSLCTIREVSLLLLYNYKLLQVLKKFLYTNKEIHITMSNFSMIHNIYQVVEHLFMMHKDSILKSNILKRIIYLFNQNCAFAQTNCGIILPHQYLFTIIASIAESNNINNMMHIIKDCNIIKGICLFLRLLLNDSITSTASTVLIIDITDMYIELIIDILWSMVSSNIDISKLCGHKLHKYDGYRLLTTIKARTARVAQTRIQYLIDLSK